MRPLAALVLVAALTAPAAAQAGVHLGGRAPLKPHHRHAKREAREEGAHAAEPPPPATPPAPAGW